MKAHVWTKIAGGNRQWNPITTDIIPAKGRFLLYGKFDPDPTRIGDCQIPNSEADLANFRFSSTQSSLGVLMRAPLISSFARKSPTRISQNDPIGPFAVFAS